MWLFFSYHTVVPALVQLSILLYVFLNILSDICLPAVNQNERSRWIIARRILQRTPHKLRKCTLRKLGPAHVKITVLFEMKLKKHRIQIVYHLLSIPFICKFELTPCSRIFHYHHDGRRKSSSAFPMNISNLLPDVPNIKILVCISVALCLVLLIYPMLPSSSTPWNYDTLPPR